MGWTDEEIARPVPRGATPEYDDGRNAWAWLTPPRLAWLCLAVGAIVGRLWG